MRRLSTISEPVEAKNAKFWERPPFRFTFFAATGTSDSSQSSFVLDFHQRHDADSLSHADFCALGYHPWMRGYRRKA
jgi:hypothetical protein